MKNFKILFALSIGSLLMLASCHPSLVDIEAEKDAIRELDRTWTESNKNKNPENMLRLLAPDVVFMIDDLPIIEGKEAVREAQLLWWSATVTIRNAGLAGEGALRSFPGSPGAIPAGGFTCRDSPCGSLPGLQ